MKSIVVLNDQDNVATSLMALENGQTVVVSVGDETRELTIRNDVPFGHKIAIRSLDSGDDVLKYGKSSGVPVETLNQAIGCTFTTLSQRVPEETCHESHIHGL